MKLVKNITIFVQVLLLFMGIHGFFLYGYTDYLMMVPLNILIVGLQGFALNEMIDDTNGGKHE